MARRPLYRGQPGTTSAAAYTSTSTYTTITAATVTNTTATAATLTVWRVPSAGSTAATNQIYNALSVAAGATVGLSGLVPKTLGKDEELHMLQGTADALTVDIDGDLHS